MDETCGLILIRFSLDWLELRDWKYRAANWFLESYPVSALCIRDLFPDQTTIDGGVNHRAVD